MNTFGAKRRSPKLYIKLCNNGYLILVEGCFLPFSYLLVLGEKSMYYLVN